MDIRQLEYFVQAARMKSFTRAAESLYISQPTISKMIRNMEIELEADLFYREGKSVRLTDAGEFCSPKRKISWSRSPACLLSWIAYEIWSRATSASVCLQW